MAAKKKTPTGDTTRTERAKAHLERLEQSNGKRLLVDLDVDGHAALNALLADGYGGTNKSEGHERGRAMHEMTTILSA